MQQHPGTTRLLSFFAFLILLLLHPFFTSYKNTPSYLNPTAPTNITLVLKPGTLHSLQPYNTATMTGIVQSLENLVSSFFALIGNVLNGILAAFQSVGAVIFTFFQQVAALVQDALGFLLRKSPLFCPLKNVFY